MFMRVPVIKGKNRNENKVQNYGQKGGFKNKLKLWKGEPLSGL